LKEVDLLPVVPKDGIKYTSDGIGYRYEPIPILVSTTAYGAEKQIHSSINPPAPETYSLSGLMKGMALFLPLLTLTAALVLMFAVSFYHGSGQKRRAREFATWFLGGLMLWISVGFLVWAVHRSLN
jgi:hypothetical protein